MALTSLSQSICPLFLTFEIGARYFFVSVPDKRKQKRKMIMVKRKRSEAQVCAKRGKENKSGTGETLYEAKEEKVAKKYQSVYNTVPL